MSSGPIRRVGLVVALHKESAARTARDIVDALAPLGVEIAVTEEVGRTIGGNLALADEHSLARSDLVLVLGGDGTFLRSARLAAPYGTPVLGIYVGGFGFLTETNESLLLSQLPRIVEGDFVVQERMMLTASLRHGDGARTEEWLALNDVVLHRGLVGGLLVCDVRVDDKLVGAYRGDGVLVATPTGSTGYSLAAGGPVVHPGVECLIITPMVLHTLNIRPLVVDPSWRVEIEVVGGFRVSEEGATVTVDGQNVALVGVGSALTVKRSDHRLRLVTLDGSVFIDRLRQKLHWGALI